MDGRKVKLLPCGDSGLLIEVESLDEVLALYSALVQAPPDGVVDLVPAARTLMLRIDPAVTDPFEVGRVVRSVRPRPGRRHDERLLEIPVAYDGEDLDEVGRLTGLGARGVIEAHTTQEWTVAFCGFAPGFAYLVGQDHRLEVPRREIPRTRVPARSVAMAGEFTGVYPRESPGGWQLLGSTTVQPWDLDRDPPSLLVPGVRVRFVEV